MPIRTRSSVSAYSTTTLVGIGCIIAGSAFGSSQRIEVTVTPSTSSSLDGDPAGRVERAETGEGRQLAKASLGRGGVVRHQHEATVRLGAVVADGDRAVADPAHELLEVGADGGLRRADLLLRLGNAGHRLLDRLHHGGPAGPEIAALAVVEDVARDLGCKAAFGILHGERAGRRIGRGVEQDALARGRDGHR